MYWKIVTFAALVLIMGIVTVSVAVDPVQAITGGASQLSSSQDVPLAASNGLSAEEAAGLAYMREVEKLARDVYIAYNNRWRLPVFRMISHSEQMHTSAVKTLLDRYGLRDPASSQVGIFNNPQLQGMYDDLITHGSQSMGEALKQGASLEEIDIQALQERAAQSSHADILQVYNMLMRGSFHHLSAFSSALKAQTGEVYQLQHLKAEDYQAIIGSSCGCGRGGK